MNAPPWWQNHPSQEPSQSQAQGQQHHRQQWFSTGHNRSTESLAGGITMQDNETDDRDDRNTACWAKSVQIVDYVIVNSSTTNIGAFVVWNIRVETLTVGVPYFRVHGFHSHASRPRGLLPSSEPSCGACEY
jgi:hypothetical protein